MSRYWTRKGPFECFHVDECDGVPVSTIITLDHNLDPLSYAFHLTQVAAWFQAIARKEIEPAVARRLRPAPHSNAKT